MFSGISQSVPRVCAMQLVFGDACRICIMSSGGAGRGGEGERGEMVSLLRFPGMIVKAFDDPHGSSPEKTTSGLESEIVFQEAVTGKREINRKEVENLF